MSFWQLCCGFSEFLPYAFPFLQRSKSTMLAYCGTLIGSKSYTDHSFTQKSKTEERLLHWRKASPFYLFCMAAFSWATHPKQYLLSVKIFTNIRLDIRKKISFERGDAFAQAALGVMESPPPEVLKKCGDVALSDAVQWYGGEGLTVWLDDLSGLFQLNSSVILFFDFKRLSLSLRIHSMN